MNRNATIKLDDIQVYLRILSSGSTPTHKMGNTAMTLPTAPGTKRPFSGAALALATAFLSVTQIGCFLDDQLPSPTPTAPPDIPTDQDIDGDGYSIDQGDCKEYDASFNPGADEAIYGQDGLDQDCNGISDNNTSGYDDDGDGYAENEGDCIDSDPSVYPGAMELENGHDDNCNIGIDEPILVVEDPTAGTVQKRAATTYLLQYIRETEYGSYQTEARIVPDMDGDGIDEIVTSMFEDDIAGRTFLVYGIPNPSTTSTPLSSAASFSIEGVGSPDLMGIELAGGDLDGDGLGDLLVGDPIHHRIAFFRGGERRTGVVSTTTADALFTPIESGAWSIGLRFDVTGDLNGDGFNDLVIGQPAFDFYRGRTLVFFGGRSFSGQIDVEQADVVLEGNEAYDYSGCNVAGIGDWDGDGYTDLLINAKYAVGNGGLPQGKLYVVWGGSDLLGPGTHSIESSPLKLISQFPSDVLRISHGDHTGDGIDDLALSFITGHRVLVIPGASGRLEGNVFADGEAISVIEPDIPPFTQEELEGATLDWSFGAAISLQSDLDRDGFADLVVASPYLVVLTEVYVDPYGSIYANAEYLNGFATVFPGAATPAQFLRPDYSRSLKISAETGTMEDVWFVAAGGDVTGDGEDDLLIGSDVWLAEVKEDYTDYVMTHHTLIFSGATITLPD